MKAIIVTVHGQESNGKRMRELAGKLGEEEFASDCGFINIRYSRLLTITNTLGWVRKMTARFIAARLETIKYKFINKEGEPKIIVIAHSNGTRATKVAMVNRDNPKMPWPDFTIDYLVLLGSPIKRNFSWSKFPETKILNFVSTNDYVVFFGWLYGMGTAGKKGFKYGSSNLNQVYVKWKHSGFMEKYELIRDYIKVYVEKIK